jgi:universal stress protein A
MEVPMLKPTNIMVPTDFSGYSDAALRQALDIGKQYSAKVHVSHIVHEHFHRGFLEFSLGDDMMQLFKDHTMSEAEENLAAQVAKFPQAKEVELTTAVKVGIPYEGILAEAKERGIDLIVIASLGKSGIAKYLIGSVARNVLREASCPVLLTK